MLARPSRRSHEVSGARLLVTGRCVRRSANARNGSRRDPCGGRLLGSVRPTPHAATSALHRCHADSRDRLPVVSETGRLGHESRGAVVHLPPAMHSTPPQPPRGREQHHRSRRHGRWLSSTAGARPVPPSSPGTCLARPPQGVARSPGATSSNGSTERLAMASRIEACALHLQGEALAAQGFHQRGALASPKAGPFSRGSSSDGLPSAVNMSARRVVAMAQSVAMLMAASTRD